MIRVVHPGSGFLSIQDPGVKKAPDLGSGSATLVCQVGHDSSIGLADAGNGMAVMKLKTNLLPFLSVVWLAPNKLLAAGHDCVPVVFFVDSAGKRMRYTVTAPYGSLVCSDFLEIPAAVCVQFQHPPTEWNPYESFVE
jgi:hypothetical protein